MERYEQDCSILKTSYISEYAFFIHLLIRSYIAKCYLGYIFLIQLRPGFRELFSSSKCSLIILHKGSEIA